MRSVLLVVVLAFGLSSLSGCSESQPKQQSGGSEGGPPPADSGAAKNAKGRPKAP